MCPGRRLVPRARTPWCGHRPRACGLVSSRRQIETQLPAPAELVIRDVRTRGKSDIEVSFPLSLGNLTNGQDRPRRFHHQGHGRNGQVPCRLVIDPARPGRKYDGMGGNFRIQSPADAAQIQYNLDNLRVAWGRVAMPLDRWQPNEDADPVEAATTGTLNTSVREAMEMAQKLARKNIPTIISIWSAPGWALAAGGGGRGGRARINPEKWDKVCKSIGSYLEYMKKNYGAEAGALLLQRIRHGHQRPSKSAGTRRGHQAVGSLFCVARAEDPNAPGRHRQSHGRPVH